MGYPSDKIRIQMKTFITRQTAFVARRPTLVQKGVSEATGDAPVHQTPACAVALLYGLLSLSNGFFS